MNFLVKIAMRSAAFFCCNSLTSELSLQRKGKKSDFGLHFTKVSNDKVIFMFQVNELYSNFLLKTSIVS